MTKELDIIDVPFQPLLEQVAHFLVDLDQWAASIIMEDRCWEAPDGLPHMTQGIYDHWIELQERRNDLLSQVSKYLYM